MPPKPKAAKRLTTTDRVNQLLSKDEPTFTSIMALDNHDLLLALNWYSQNKAKEDSHKYLQLYCKQHGIKVTASQIDSQVSTVGFICRMVSRGAILDTPSVKWLDSRLAQMIKMEVLDTPKVPVMAQPVKPVPTIQDRLKEKSSKCIGALEGVVDDFILSDFKKHANILEVMREHDIKGAHGPAIVNFFKKWRDEFRVALTEKDAAINEAYCNYTLVQMKKMEALYDQIISDTLKLMGEAMAQKQPRVKKPKSPEKQVKSIKYCEEDTTLKLTSIPPIRIVGAEQVFVYNRKNRMLTQYIADDANGLGVKGSAFTNWSKEKTRSKKLRKPEDVLTQIVGGGKVYLRNVIANLTTKDGKVTGRAGKDVLLLRVIV